MSNSNESPWTTSPSAAVTGETVHDDSLRFAAATPISRSSQLFPIKSRPQNKLAVFNDFRK